MQLYSALINYVFSNCKILKKSLYVNRQKKITGKYANNILHVNMQQNDTERKLKVCTVYSKVSSAGFRTLSNNISGNF